MRPYSQIKEGSVIVRKFSETSSDDELVWHRDENDREVTVISGAGWKFQYDDGLPFDMCKGDVILVPKDSWHRIIKGEGDLVVSIRETR